MNDGLRFENAAGTRKHFGWHLIGRASPAAIGSWILRILVFMTLLPGCDTSEGEATPPFCGVCVSIPGRPQNDGCYFDGSNCCVTYGDGTHCYRSSDPNECCPSPPNSSELRECGSGGRAGGSPPREHRGAWLCDTASGTFDCLPANTNCRQ